MLWTTKCNCSAIASSALDLDECCAVDKYLVARGLSSVVWCGNNVTYTGNYSKKCGFSIVMNSRQFPDGRFSVDATGKERKRYLEKRGTSKEANTERRSSFKLSNQFDSWGVGLLQGNCVFSNQENNRPNRTGS